jgi:hypothetical protein
VSNKLTVCISGDIDSFESESIEECLEPYFKVLEKYQVKMTIPITAKVVEDYPERVKFILKKGHEVAIHGDVHQPFYGSVEEQISRLERAKSVFSDTLGFVPTGFRAPWLQHDKNTYIALINTGFLYDSSQTRSEVPYLPQKLPFLKSLSYDWMALPLIRPVLRSLKNLRRHIDPYKCQAKPCYLYNRLIELPITNPDDWFLISYKKGPQYSPAQAYRIAKVWLDIVTDMKQRENQLFVIQAHPGRMSPHYLEALNLFLEVLKGDNNVEIKTLEEVAKMCDFSTDLSK